MTSTKPKIGPRVLFTLVGALAGITSTVQNFGFVSSNSGILIINVSVYLALGFLVGLSVNLLSDGNTLYEGYRHRIRIRAAKAALLGILLGIFTVKFAHSFIGSDYYKYIVGTIVFCISIFVIFFIGVMSYKDK